MSKKLILYSHFWKTSNITKYEVSQHLVLSYRTLHSLNVRKYFVTRTCHKKHLFAHWRNAPFLQSKFRRRRHRMSKWNLPAVSWQLSPRQNYIPEGSFQSQLCFLFRFSIVYIVAVLSAFTKLWMWLLASSCLPVRLPILMQQLGCHRTDVHAIWCLITFLKSIEKNQVSWKSYKNNVYFTWRPMYICNIISLTSC